MENKLKVVYKRIEMQIDLVKTLLYIKNMSEIYSKTTKLVYTLTTIPVCKTERTFSMSMKIKIFLK